jgi:hypothetical protein
MDLDLDIDYAYIDNKSDTDVEQKPKQPRKSRPGGLYTNGYHHQPPTTKAAHLAFNNLMSLLHPLRQKQKEHEAGNAVCKILLDPDTLTQLEDIWNLL